MTKPVEAITVRLNALEAERLDEAAALLSPREATRAKQIKRIVDAMPDVWRERREFWDRAQRAEKALEQLCGPIYDRAQAEAAIELAREEAQGVLHEAENARAVVYGQIVDRSLLK